MPTLDFRRLRAAVPIEQVLDLLGFVVVERSAGQVRGRCPLHEPGKCRSFSVHLAGKKFQCFKCGASGNVLDLWAEATKKPIYDAGLDLCARLNIEPPLLASGTEKRNP